MGTGYDCFDVKSYGQSTAIAPEQRQWRDLLNSVMRGHGFAGYFREWWHFSYNGAAEIARPMILRLHRGDDDPAFSGFPSAICPAS